MTPTYLSRSVVKSTPTTSVDNCPVKFGHLQLWTLLVMFFSEPVRRMKRRLRRAGSVYVVIPLRIAFIKMRLRIFGAPRVLNYGMSTNAIILRELGANIGKDNVRILSPITVHRADLRPDCSNLTIEDNCVLNGNHFLDLSSKVTLRSGVSLGPGVIIMSHNFYNGNKFLQDRLPHTCGYKEVLIKEGAGIKAGAIIVMGVTIGKNSVVGAQALVNRDVPDNCFAAGVPAQVVKTIA